MIAITTCTCPAIRKMNDYDQGLVISISGQKIPWKLNTLLCFVQLQIIYISIWKSLLISYLEKWPGWIKIFDKEYDSKESNVSKRVKDGNFSKESWKNSVLADIVNVCSKFPYIKNYWRLLHLSDVRIQKISLLTYSAYTMPLICCLPSNLKF